jgi:hypothetical protein
MKTLLSLLIAALVVTGSVYSQNEHQVPPPKAQAFGPKFFEELQRMFKTFSGGDLHHIFQQARAIRCSEVTGAGREWRDVAYFSGKAKFGNWVLTNSEEVDSGLAVYIFDGVCRDESSILRVTTKVPVEGGPDVRVNPAVTALFHTDTKAYTFELPYLFRGRDQNGGRIYTFNPQHASDRYITHITSRWECKELTEEYVTHRFLICHTMLFGSDPVDITHGRDKPSYSFGASAYSILADGRIATD